MSEFLVADKNKCKIVQSCDMGLENEFDQDWKENKHYGLYDKLCSGDSQAWKYVIKELLRRVVPKNKVLRQGLYDLNWGADTEAELLSRLYRIMIDKEKIEKYEHRCPIQEWMVDYVRQIVSDEYNERKKQKELQLKCQQEDQEDSDILTTIDKSERLAIAQRGFVKLCDEKRQQAFVLYFRDKMNLRARQAALMLDVTEDNLHQLHKRGRDRLRELVNIEEKRG